MKNLMKALISWPLLCMAMPAFSGVNTAVSVHVKNLGKAQFSYMRSYGGMMAAVHQTPELPSDSCITIDLGSEGTVEHVVLLLLDNERADGMDIYLAPGETCDVTADPTAESVFTSTLPENILSAIAAANSGYDTFMDFVMGSADRLGLRADSTAASVVKKLTAVADNAETAIADAPAALVTPLRQHLRLGILCLMDECTNRWLKRGLSENEAARWREARKSLHAWAATDAPENALSTIYRSALDSDINRALFDEWNSEGIPSREWINRHSFDLYRNNLSGKNAEAMMASVIINDTGDKRYTEGIPTLAKEFSSLYPSSPLLSLVETSAAENARRNAPQDTAGINFIDAHDVSTIADLIDRYRGQPVLVDFWATWCGPCRKSFSGLDPVRKVAADNGVALLYVSIDTDPDAADKVRNVVKRLGVKGDHVVAGEKLYKDIFATFGTPALLIPHTALYDSDGKLVVKKFDSSEDPDTLATDLIKILKKEP